MVSSGSAYSPTAPSSIRDRFVDILNESVRLRDLKVLELGCGDGVFTERLAAVSGHVHASDARGDQVNKAVNRVHKTNVFFSTIRVGKGKEIFPDFSFNVVFHVGLLYHLNRPVEHLRELGRIADTAVFLDTHYAMLSACSGHYRIAETNEVVLCQEQPEDPDAQNMRSGVDKTSRWITKERIIAELSKSFPVLKIIDDRVERNGPRITILARKHA